MKLYNPHDDPIHLGHGGVEHVLPANSDVELPDEVGARALVRHAETGLVVLPGTEFLDGQARKVAEERYTLYLKRRMGLPSEATQSIFKSAVKRGLVPGGPAEPVPEPEAMEPKKKER